MKLLIPLFISTIFTCISCDAQEYSYTNYDISDGLAGSTAYCIAQDKEGFMWIGTETGLSRFDGTHFTNYTTADGLPDLEVLQMFCDSKGRLWMALFHPSVCYYYKGKIHNPGNDSLLARIHCSGYIEGMSEDRDGNILLQEPTALHLITNDGRVIDYHDINGRPLKELYIAGGDKSGDYFVVFSGDDLYRLRNGRFTLLAHIPHVAISTLSVAANSALFVIRSNAGKTLIINSRTGQLLRCVKEQYYKGQQSYALCGDSLVYTSFATGVRELNIRTGETKWYVTGIQANRTFRDDEDNLWFSTVGQGIYRLNSNEVKNYTLRTRTPKPGSALFINKDKDEILIGTIPEMVFSYRPRQQSLKAYQAGASPYGYVTYAERNPRGQIIYGCQDQIGIMLDSMRSKILVWDTQIKYGVHKTANELIFGNSRGVFVLDMSKWKIKDTLWRTRCSGLLLMGDTLYIATLEGLYELDADRSTHFLGDSIPFLRKRISAIAAAGNHTLWVASHDAGVIGLHPGQPPIFLTTQQGLSSNICRTLTMHGNDLWIGTDKGLNRVRIGQGEPAITRYTAKDGLASDMINVVYVDGDTVYVGTPEGFSYFNPMLANLTARCRLVFLGITNSGKDRLQDTANLVLHHTDNNIRFDYAGISYKSTGNITYHYRMSGLDSSWKTTKETFLDYPTLPSGDYELEMYAVNKFGVKSRTKTIPFAVETPFWRALWFELLILASFIALTWLFVSLRIKHIRRQQEEEELLNKRMKEMEHIALQAQMNPHFIFNCLNSIQQYIFDQDILAANKYITGFAKLIRATLHHSTKDLIPLEDELEYLSNYLSLEKLRFKEKMNFSIDVAHDLPVNRGYLVPPMIIQPYVENCMRHGLRHRRTAGGYIRIKLQEHEGKLVVVVEDNGIGREKAASYKTREHIEYQSKGMSLTADRIRLINAIHEDNIEVEIIDLKDGQGGAAGTRVVIKFPKFESSYQENAI
ncbi:MAG TPA: histidine kinase [Puia sp.]